MTDLAVLAFGFGVMPLAAILLYSVARAIVRHREASWGILAGVTGFLGLSHAMASVLEKHSLFGDAALATLVSVIGLAIGAGVGWILLEGPFVRTEPNRIVAAAIVFLGLHSLGDGLVLGAAFIGGFSPTVPIDAPTVSATAVHRFVEGSLVVVPALAASWRSRFAFLALFVSLASVPAAYVPRFLFDVYGASATGSVIALGIPTFAAAMEASLALFLLARGFLPLASVERGNRWLVWTGLGFVGMSLVHFLVE